MSTISIPIHPILYKSTVNNAGVLTAIALIGRDGRVSADPVRRRVLINNGAAGTDVKAVTTGTGPFNSVAVGDVLVVNLLGVRQYRRVVTRASADVITVDASISLPTDGSTFSYLTYTASAGVEQMFRPGTLYVEAFTATVDVEVRGRVKGNATEDVVTASTAVATGAMVAIQINGNYDYMRFFFGGTGATATAIFRDATNYVTAYISGTA